jgi:molybdate transport system substrate-binding protein
MQRELRRTSSVLTLLALGELAACERAAPTPREPIRVAAASDLSQAFPELARGFQAQTGLEVRFTFGSTGLLARQLRDGAPFDVFAAAQASFVEDVVRAGVCEADTRAAYGRGRLALWSAAPRTAGSGPRTLRDLLDPRYQRIAIANPEHAPYGKAAREALQQSGLWQQLEGRILLAENVRQALQFAESGNAEAALVALSLVIEDRSATWTAVDPALHAPIEQTLVACSRGKRAADGRRFAAYVGSPAGRAVMRRFGFLLAGESLSAASAAERPAVTSP